MRSTLRLSTLSACLLLLWGCATAPGVKPDPRDPWERMNRGTYRFNDAFDRAIAKPVARGYRKVTPQFVRTGIGNFFDNLGYPIVMVNDLLQGQLKAFASDTGRLVMNTTLGIGGLLDPASAAGLDKNDRDFGQTLGKWGLRPGPYLVIPFLGPSDVRDAFGRVGDEYTDPRHYIRNTWLDYGLWTVHAVDTRARLLDAESIIAGAYDPYAFIRNAYLQHRQFKVQGGQSTNEEEQERKLMDEMNADEPGAGQTSGSAAPPAPSAPTPHGTTPDTAPAPPAEQQPAPPPASPQQR